MSNIGRRLKQFEANKDYDYIVLKDGGRFWYKPDELYQAFSMYYLACLGVDGNREERPPVPDIFLALADAADREEAMDQVLPEWRSWRTNHSISTAIDLDVLVEEGRIEPYSEFDAHLEAWGMTYEEFMNSGGGFDDED